MTSIEASLFNVASVCTRTRSQPALSAGRSDTFAIDVANGAGLADDSLSGVEPGPLDASSAVGLSPAQPVTAANAATTTKHHRLKARRSLPPTHATGPRERQFPSSSRRTGTCRYGASVSSQSWVGLARESVVARRITTTMSARAKAVRAELPANVFSLATQQLELTIDGTIAALSTTGRAHPNVEGRVAGEAVMTRSPPHKGERHPDGDELLYLVEGVVEVEVEHEDE